MIKNKLNTRSSPSLLRHNRTSTLGWCCPLQSALKRLNYHSECSHKAFTKPAWVQKCQLCEELVQNSYSESDFRQKSALFAYPSVGLWKKIICQERSYPMLILGQKGGYVLTGRPQSLHVNSNVNVVVTILAVFAMYLITQILIQMHFHSFTNLKKRTIWMFRCH